MSLSIRGPNPVEMFDNPPWSDAPFPRTPFRDRRWQRPLAETLLANVKKS